LESKGFARASVSENAMEEYKQQAASGPISVHRSFASVAFDLYSRPKIKYYDPPAKAAYDGELNQKLRTAYYETVLKSVQWFKKRENETILQSDYTVFEFDKNFFPCAMLVHEKILNREWETLNWLESIPRRGIDGDGYFIDADGIGLRFSKEDLLS